MSPLPIGTVTFLFTDIEGSTRRWEAHGDAMAAALRRHDAILRTAIDGHGGTVFKTMGDAFCAVFASPPDAVAAAIAAQEALAAQDWSAYGADFAPLRVRMALHTGLAEYRESDYFGPTLNRVARLLAAGHGGQVLLSGAATGLARDGMRGTAGLIDLGEHRLKDLECPEHVWQLEAPGLARDFPPIRTLDTHPNNLPHQLGSFVGREDELDALSSALASHRLVTLTGIGGTGKTRLALQAAAEALRLFPDGAWMVDLAPLLDGDLVAGTLATALEVKPQPGQDLIVTLVSELRLRRLLVVLDNCEHLLGDCARLVERLVHACPGLTVMATSREPLGVAGEQVLPLAPLLVPDAARWGRGRPTPTAKEVEDLQHVAAVRLFVERARAAQSAFQVNSGNAVAVASICHQLDGIPLALELAAARVRSLPVDQLAARLVDRFRLLTGGARTMLPRQQTLRATLDWSFDLLAPAEQRLLTRLAIFRGGWTLEAAEEVCSDGPLPPVPPEPAVGLPGAPAPEACNYVPASYVTELPTVDEPLVGTPIDALDVLDLMARLVDRSLVVPDTAAADGTTRYRFLEIVRAYALERLQQSGEDEAMVVRHLRYVHRFFHDGDIGIRGTETLQWLRRIRPEVDNYRAAAEGAADRPSLADEAAALAADAGQSLRYLDCFDEQIRRTSEAAAKASAGTRPAAYAVYWSAHSGSGPTAQGSEALKTATAKAQHAAECFMRANDILGHAWALHSLGRLAKQAGDLDTAELALEGAVEKKRSLGLVWDAIRSMVAVSELARQRGDVSKAMGVNVEALILTETDPAADPSPRAQLRSNQGYLAVTAGNAAYAAVMLGEALDGYLALDQLSRATETLGGVATLAELINRPVDAARLGSFVDADLTRLTTTLAQTDATDLARGLDRARAALDPPAWDAAWAEGQAMTPDAAQALARQVIEAAEANAQAS